MDEHPDQPIRPARIVYPDSPRLQRIRIMSRLLDQSIVLPGGYRIGIDPLIGLIPGIGDFIGMTLSFYIIYQAARLGIPRRILLAMCGNALIETLVGQFPILGDIFDAVWKANVRNTRLVEKYYNPAQPERSRKKILVSLGAVFFTMLFGVAAIAAWIMWSLISLFR